MAATNEQSVCYMWAFISVITSAVSNSLAVEVLLSLVLLCYWRFSFDDPPPLACHLTSFDNFPPLPPVPTSL